MYRTSITRANGWFERIEHSERLVPRHNKICVFRFLNSYPEPPQRPVEQRVCGTVPSDLRPKWDLTRHPWYLNIPSFLHLTGVRDNQSVSHMMESRHRMNRLQSGVYSPAVPEFGRHFYVNFNGFLCCFDVWKAFRKDAKLANLGEHYITDVCPRLNGSNMFQSETPRLQPIKTIVFRGVQEDCAKHFTRWWSRHGRDTNIRFQESYLPCTAGFYDSLRASFYFIVYVDSRARLIMSDPITGYRREKNYTLVQSGVRIVCQCEFFLNFMDNTQRLYSCVEVLRVHYTRQRISVADFTRGFRPVFVLRAVPSIGESLCWGLEFEAMPQTIKRAILNVPLLGMNHNRFEVYNLEDGRAYMDRCDRACNYSQFATTDRNYQIPHQRMECAQFQANEPLNYPQMQPQAQAGNQ